MKKLAETFRDKPWLFVVFGAALFVALDIVLVVIATMNPPEMLR